MIEEAIRTGVIEPSDLNDLMASASIKLIDASFVLPTSNENPFQNYLTKRIGNAVFFDITQIKNHDSSLPNMLPSPEQFSSAVSKLGINNDDMIVVYGQSGITMGPARVWWMFRTFGHNKICVLNGGLPAWEKQNFPTTNTLPQKPEASPFNAEFSQGLVKTIDQVSEALNENVTILDARSKDRFSGSHPEPRAGMRSGHIPGSINLPCMSLINSETGQLKSTDELRQTFENVGYDFNTPVITTCGSGVTACVITLALYNLGYKDIPVYDGSWSEWGQESSNTEITTT